MKNNILLTFRNLFKHRINTFINLFGLTIALSLLMLIVIWIRLELSFDQFHIHADNIYRIVDGNPADKESFAGSPSPIGLFYHENFPEVVSFTRLDMLSEIVKAENVSYNEAHIAAVDTSFFSIFSFPVIRGNKKHPLEAPRSVILSEYTAKKYFGKSDPLGKSVILNDSMDYEVTGVFKNNPVNSHLQFDLVIRFDSQIRNDRWDAWNFFTYIQLKPDISAGEFKNRTIQWAQNKYRERLDMFKEIFYQPLKQIHYQYNRKNLQPTIEKSTIRAFIVIALFILIIACINFTNLTVIEAVERSKEIAVRKIMGETKFQLVLSMITETFLMSVIAFFFAILLVENLTPFIGKVLGSPINFSLSDPVVMITGLVLIVLSAVFSGIYPALLLSSSRPADLFVKSFKVTKKFTLGNVLIIGQFAISILLIISILIMNRQMRYMRNLKLGMNCENVINIPLQSNSNIMQAKTIKQEFLKCPGIISASVNSYLPSTLNEHWGGFSFNNNPDEVTNEDMGLWIILADIDFMKTMEINILEGEEMIRNYTSSDIPFILNESAAQMVKGNNLIGREFLLWGSYKARIIGKVKDFHFRSLHHKIEPAAIIFYDRGNQVSLRYQTADFKAMIASLEKVWNHISPDLKMEYYFLDEDLNTLYKNETKTNKIVGFSGILSLLLCCLGIFGIVAYSAQKRTKEIGIRKVNGASIGRIMVILSKDYAWWIVLSSLIAFPAAYLIMKKWLTNFAYKISIPWWAFMVAGMLVFTVAILTSCWQSWRVANQNPVDALKYE